MTLPDLRNVAQVYAHERGWSVFPVHGVVAGRCTCGSATCGNPGKHPVPSNGLKAATRDPRQINLLFRPGHNLAIATGEASGFWALDIDGAAGEASLAALEAEHGQLPQTLVHFTGKGKHLFFLWKDPVKNSVRQLGDGLDVRGDGGYIVAAPSVHASGAQYRFADAAAPIAEAPAWLAGLVAKKATPPTAPVERYVEPEHDLSQDQVEHMLGYLHPDCDYQTWLEVGMALHAGAYPVATWDQWSAGGQKYRAGECHRKWRGFRHGGAITMGTLWHHAMQAGWRPEPSRPVLLAGPHPAAAFLDKLRRRVNPPTRRLRGAAAPGRLPFNPLELPGPIGETVRWIVGSAIRPQPELALANVFAALGAVFGRRYASEWDTRTNLYVVGIAGTGSGKDHSRKAVKKLLAAAGQHHLLAGDSIVSGAGLLRGLHGQPCQVLHLDEFGMLLRAITQEDGPAHLRSIAKALLELFSSSGSIFHGGHYASGDVEPIVIDHPHLCIYATTALETYREGLTRSAISSGELNRFLVIPAVDDLPRASRSISDVQPPERLVAQWAAFGATIAPGQGNLVGVGGKASAPPSPILVRWAGVLDRIHDIGDRADDVVRAAQKTGTGGIWTRYREQVLKLAMIQAIARNPAVPIMEDADLDLAEAIVRASCEYVAHLAADHLADNRHERTVNQVLDILRAAGDWVTKSQLSRQLRGLSGRDRAQILDDLVNVQEVVEMRVERSSAGRPVHHYRLAAGN
jgi:hypothetical protein